MEASYKHMTNSNTVLNTTSQAYTGFCTGLLVNDEGLVLELLDVAPCLVLLTRFTCI
jgi:hypothetical protein